MVLKTTGKEYITKKRIEKMMKKYNESPEECLWKDTLQPNEEQGFIKIVEGQPVAVDPLLLWAKGKPNERDNPNYGKPLDVNSVQKTVEGVFMYEGAEKKFLLSLNDDSVHKLDIPMLVPVKMRLALGGNIDSDTIRLIAKRGSGFDILEGKKINVAELAEKNYKDVLIEIGDIEEEMGKKSEKDYNFHRMIKGQVMDLNLTPDKNGKGSFRLLQESMDFDKNYDCRIKVPEEWLETIDFGEYSTVYVYGSPWVFTPEGQSKMVGMTAFGIYPVEKVKPLQTNGAKESDVNGNGEVPKEAEEFKEFNEFNKGE